jgi:hypothetical protein
MTTQELTTATAAGIKEQLTLLERERATAALTGLADNDRYIEDLRHELEATRAAYVGAAVTEIASLRAALDGPLVG